MMKATLLTRPLLVLLALAGPVSSAAEAHFGGQLTAVWPQSDLGGKGWMDGKVAPSLGVHLLVDMEDGNALVPRLDYTLHSRSLNTVDNLKADRKADVWNLGVDYNYFFSGRASEGFYLTAGLGYASAKFQIDDAGETYRPTKGAVAYALGAGYQFNPNLGLEVRYTASRFNDVAYGPALARQSVDVNAPALTASLLFRY
jgi:opacity protein-like surface antigen